MRLFCLPYAGAGASVYRSWRQELGGGIDVCPIQLPGRERRIREAPYRRIGPLVEHLARDLYPWLNVPFAIFGHSMGALVGFELIRYLRAHHGRQPVHFFASGRPAPQLPGSGTLMHCLPEEEFVAALRRFQGTPAGVLESPELCELVFPILRADFEVVETYAYQPEPPLDCALTAFGGTEDAEVSEEELEAWHEHTSLRFARHMIPGNHFYLHSASSRLLQNIRNELTLLMMYA